MRVALVGAVRSTAEALTELVGRRLDPLVLTLPPSQSHRHSDYVDLASTFPDVRLQHISSINSAEAISILATEAPDLLLIFGWSQICPKEILSMGRIATLGCHPSALPKNRGRGVIPWTIIQGARDTAMTIFHLSETVDAGDVVAQLRFTVDPRETALTLYDKHLRALRSALSGILDDLANGASIQRKPQDEDGATWCMRRVEQDGLIALGEAASTVDRTIRANTRPYPGAYIPHNSGRIRIWSGHDLDAPRYWARPGQVLYKEGESVAVMCGDGRAIVLDDWVEEQGAKMAGPHGQLGPIANPGSGSSGGRP